MTRPTTATHHRAGDLDVDRPMSGIERRRLVGEQAMIALVSLARGTVVPEHRHPNEQFAYVLEGELRFSLGEESERAIVVATAGDIVHLPGDVLHGVEVLADARVLDVFAPPSEGTGLDRPETSGDAAGTP